MFKVLKTQIILIHKKIESRFKNIKCHMVKLQDNDENKLLFQIK